MIERERNDGRIPGRHARSTSTAPAAWMASVSNGVDHGRRLMPGDRVMVGRSAYQTSMLEVRDPCADVHPVIGKVEALRDEPDGTVEVAVRLDCDQRIHRFQASDLLPFE